MFVTVLKYEGLRIQFIQRLGEQMSAYWYNQVKDVWIMGVVTVVMTLATLAAGRSALAATYYACDCGPGSRAACVSGSNAAAGTSPTTPWKSVAKARQAFGTLAAGDTIAFCRGGSFTVDGGSWVNNRCKADTPCTITDYAPPWGTGGEGRALINTPVGKYAFSFADGGNADHEEGYVVSNLELRGTNGTGYGFFLFNDIDDVVLDNLVVSAFDVGVLIQGSNTPNTGSNGRNERITLKNSRIIDNAGQGFEGSCDGCSIINTIFDNNGYRGATFYHNLYWDGAVASTGGRIAGNTLTRSAVVANKCQGVSLVVHGIHANLTIENNIIQEEVGSAVEGCWGIAVDTGYASAEAFTGLIVRGNTINNVGNVGIGLNACSDCLIEGNSITQGQSFSTIAINIPDRARGAEDGVLDRVTVRNNTITLNNNAAQTAMVLGGEGTGHSATGNTVTYAGSVAGWNCFSYPLAVTAYAAIDTNNCRFPAATTGNWEKARGSLANWQSVSGFDLHSSQQ